MSRFKRGLQIFVLLLCLSFAGVGLVPASAGAQQPTTGPVMQDTPCRAGDACESFLQRYINPFIVLLTVTVGVVAAISLVVAGIQYASAGSDPGKVQKAKDRIIQTIIGLLAYIFLFAFLNYVVPGGFLG